MTIMELYNLLGKEIEALKDTTLTEEERRIASEQVAPIVDISRQMISAANLINRYENGAARSGSLTTSKMRYIIGE